MAALFQTADNSEHATPREESFSEETLDQSCDVILVVEDGKEIKAHKRVLSEASPFFEKLFNSDMKESKEGMVRLEMFSESVMRNTLEFIYTGSVEILAEHNAQQLIVMADYLLLENLQTLAEEVIVQKLNTLNCISTYYFSQRYQCQGLFAKTKTFILANFTAVYEANREDVLNMSSKEIEMWISSDEIDVSVEEDVFKIILAWINCDKEKRKENFAELLLQVRLIYVSRDFLCSDIVTNELVKSNEACLALVEDAVNIIDSKIYDKLSVTPRKSLETSAIVCPTFDDRFHYETLCYFPCEDRWCSLGKDGKWLHSRIGLYYDFKEHIVSCRGKLYYWPSLGLTRLESYNLYFNCWTSLPYKDVRKIRQIFVRNEVEMYAFMEDRHREYDTSEQDKCVCYITKYKPESNSWEEISSFDHLDPTRQDICIVAKDNFVYFIGGRELRSDLEWKLFADVDRYDLGRDQWDKVADMQEPKTSPSGAAANGKIFIAEGAPSSNPELHQCEAYNETTNEWQLIAGFNLSQYPKLLSVDGKLYTLSNHSRFSSVIQCYNPDKNEWNRVTEISNLFGIKRHVALANAYSVRIFKGFLSDRPELKPRLKRDNPSERNCFIL